MKKEIKDQKDFIVKDIYMEIMKLSDFDCGADRICTHAVPDHEGEHGVDCKGIQRFILKYENISISLDKIRKQLF